MRLSKLPSAPTTPTSHDDTKHSDGPNAKNPHASSAHSDSYEPAGAVSTHEAAGDPHTGYQKESEKGAASGYASLDAGTKVPTAELGGAGADATKFLRGDQSWQVPAGGGGSGDRIQDADNDTYLDAEVGTDPDKIQGGIPAASSTFFELFKGAESLPRVVIGDDGFRITDGATAGNDIYIRKSGQRNMQLFPASSPAQHSVEYYGETGDPSSPASANIVRMYNKIFGTGTAMFNKYSSGQVVGPLGDKALATVYGRGPSGGVEPPLSTTWSDGVWGTLAPAGSWTPTGTPSVANDTAANRGRHMNFASGAVSGNDAGIESTAVFWGNMDSSYLFRIRLPSTADIRMFVGVSVGTLANMVGADSPAFNSMGIQYSTPRGDTNWKFYERGTIGGTIVGDTGVAVSTNAIYIQVISGIVNQIVLLDAGMNPLASRNAGFLSRPGATELVRLIVGIETQTAAAKDIELYHIKEHSRTS